MLHLHYLSLWRLAEELHIALHQAVWVESFSQQKDELIIEFLTPAQENSYLRISCLPSFPYLVPIQEYNRAGKNTISLFPELSGAVVLQVRILPGDRVLGIQLQIAQEQHWLVCQMYGSKSNVFHFQGLELKNTFMKKWTLSNLLDCSAFEEDPWAWLETHSYWRFWDKDMQEKYGKALQISVIQTLMAQNVYVTEEPVQFMYGTSGTYTNFSSISEALALFLRQKYREQSWVQLRTEVEHKIATEIQKRKRKIQSWWTSIEHLSSARSYEEIGHLILAYISHIEPYSKQIEVEDWYTQEKTTITLDPKLNAQENAQAYYRKHKLRQKEEKYLLKQIEEAEKQLDKWLTWEQEYQAITYTKPLEKWIKNHPEVRLATRVKEKQELPFRKFEKGNYLIFVGRDNKNNDLLTVQYAKKGDIWLHVKDIAGSHVVIRNHTERLMPLEVLEYAAGLAAWYSKARNQSWVPVIYTDRKYVRKGKGFAPGMVTVEREDVIFVQPLKPGRED